MFLSFSLSLSLNQSIKWGWELRTIRDQEDPEWASPNLKEEQIVLYYTSKEALLIFAQ